eukprot:g56.t1
MWSNGCSSRMKKRGLKPLTMSDGPSGVRGFHMTSRTPSFTAPCLTALAATFDQDLVSEVGAAIGEEAKALGANILLAPTLNMHRLPITGRHFECFSECPHLTSSMGVAYIRGVQSTGVGACAKHFVGNDLETNRSTVCVEIDERAMREVYYRPFEAAVREAAVASVMTAYNRVNGRYAAESPLLRQVVREEWGFEGIFVSDWWGNHSTTASLKAGLNLEMPGNEPRHFGERLLKSAVTDDELRAAARPVVNLMAQGAKPSGASADGGTKRDLARRAAAAGIVLLKNDSGALPLGDSNAASEGTTRNEKLKLLVVGHNAAFPAIQGGGSARVSPPRCVSYLSAIRTKCSTRGWTVAFEAGPSWRLPVPEEELQRTAPC